MEFKDKLVVVTGGAQGIGKFHPTTTPETIDAEIATLLK